MWRKREIARYRYTIPEYKSISYTLNTNGGGTVNLTEFLNDLHTIQLDCIEEALEKSDLKEANEVIAYIKEKL